jgi:protein Mpv17
MALIWKAYGSALSAYPLPTQMFTSAVIWGLGDLTAQSLERRGTAHVPGTVPRELEWQRAAIQASYAAGVWTPIAVSWYGTLDLMALRVAAPGTAAFVAFKLGLEVAVLHPIALAVFFGCMGAARGDNFEVVRSKFEREFFHTLAFEMGLWTPLDIALFSVVPVRHQLMVVNSGTHIHFIEKFVEFLTSFIDYDVIAPPPPIPSQFRMLCRKCRAIMGQRHGIQASASTVGGG